MKNSDKDANTKILKTKKNPDKVNQVERAPRRPKGPKEGPKGSSQGPTDHLTPGLQNIVSGLTIRIFLIGRMSRLIYLIHSKTKIIY